MKIALISVYDKRGIEDFAGKLLDRGYHILSTGGTAKKLKEKFGADNPSIMEVSDYTGWPESPKGLVKTLHPKIHAGLLMLRDNPEEFGYMVRTGSFPIDIVAVNLYPFAETIAKEGVKLEEAVEQIDIGGPTMLRSAAKGMLRSLANGVEPFLGKSLTVVVDPGDYDEVFRMFQSAAFPEPLDGDAPEVLRNFTLELAQKVYAHTAKYDETIAGYLAGLKHPR